MMERVCFPDASLRVQRKKELKLSPGKCSKAGEEGANGGQGEFSGNASSKVSEQDGEKQERKEQYI